jgi:hypothetical protein
MMVFCIANTIFMPMLVSFITLFLSLKWSRQVVPVKEALLQHNLNLFLWTDRLMPTNVVKNLSVFFDEGLTGVHHVNQFYVKFIAVFVSYIISTIFCQSKLVQSLVFPYFDYGDLVFFNIADSGSQIRSDAE